MGKKLLYLACATTLIFFAATAFAEINLELAGKPLRLSGYVNQGANFQIAGDHTDTMDGLAQLPFQFLLEAKWDLSHDLQFFVSGKINTDWAYDFLSNDSEWEKKGFGDSRDEIYFLDAWNDILTEAHLTWTPGNFNIRVGKQVVIWGEMDNTQVTSVMMPTDYRRGITDQEFETTFIPITLAKAEYFVPLESEWLLDLALEFTFNPNAKFRANEGFGYGRDVSGVWAPNVPLGPGVILGSSIASFDTPDNFSSDGHEFALRLKAMAWDSVIQLMFFYGRDNNPVSYVVDFRGLGFYGFDDIDFSDDGLVVGHLVEQGYYPLQRMIGASFSRELPLSVSFLGGVRPLMRLEAAYFMDNTYMDYNQTSLFKEDELRWGIGLDWSVKIPWLNSKAFFDIYPEFVSYKLIDPTDTIFFPGLGPIEPTLFWQNARQEANYYTLAIQTTYFHTKLMPTFYVGYESKSENWTTLVNFTYQQSHQWSYSLQFVAAHGDDDDPLTSSKILNNKDYASFTVKYQF